MSETVLQLELALQRFELYSFKFLKSNSKIDSNASMSMQQGINIITTEFLKNKWVVSFCLDCQGGLSFSFCLLSRPERLEAHGFSFASFGSSLGLAFGLTVLVTAKNW